MSDTQKKQDVYDYVANGLSKFLEGVLLACLKSMPKEEAIKLVRSFSQNQRNVDSNE